MNYCKANDIHTVIIGDITNIRRNKNLGKVTNQKLHAPQVTKEYAKKLVAQMTVEEKMSQMLYESPAIERLNIPAYN